MFEVFKSEIENLKIEEHLKLSLLINMISFNTETLSKAEFRQFQQDVCQYFQTKVSAEKDDFQTTIAHFFLGYMHLYGYGCEKNTKEAVRNLDIAVKENFAPAMTLKAQYLLERETSVDNQRPYQLLHDARDQKDPIALATFGYFFLKGINCGDINLQIANKETAIELMRTAARQGNAIIQYQLGLYLQQSRDSQLEEEALSLLRKAALQGLDKAQFALGTYLARGIKKKREDVKAKNKRDRERGARQLFTLPKHSMKFTEEEIEAKKWLAESAKSDDLELCYELGNFYEENEVCTVEQTEVCYVITSDFKNIEESVTRDLMPIEVFNCFDKAAKSGHVEAGYKVGSYLYKYYKGFKKELHTRKLHLDKPEHIQKIDETKTRAFTYLEKAAEANAERQLELAEQYREIGNYEKWYEWLVKAKNNNQDAKLLLAEFDQAEQTLIGRSSNINNTLNGSSYSQFKVVNPDSAQNLKSSIYHIIKNLVEPRVTILSANRHHKLDANRYYSNLWSTESEPNNLRMGLIYEYWKTKPITDTSYEKRLVYCYHLAEKAINLGTNHQMDDTTSSSPFAII